MLRQRSASGTDSSLPQNAVTFDNTDLQCHAQMTRQAVFNLMSHSKKNIEETSTVSVNMTTMRGPSDLNSTQHLVPFLALCLLQLPVSLSFRPVQYLESYTYSADLDLRRNPYPTLPQSQKANNYGKIMFLWIKSYFLFQLFHESLFFM